MMQYLMELIGQKLTSLFSLKNSNKELSVLRCDQNRRSGGFACYIRRNLSHTTN